MSQVVSVLSRGQVISDRACYIAIKLAHLLAKGLAEVQTTTVQGCSFQMIPV